MAMRSAKVSMERRADGGLNDNYPSVLPGHELTGLEGVPRPPAGEAVVHYSRFTEISSFPTHPAEPASDASEPPAMDVLVEKSSGNFSLKRKNITAAYLGSCFFHIALVVAVLWFAIPPLDDVQQEEGDTLNVVMLGTSDVDEVAAGERSKQPPEPEQVEAEAVQPDTVQPTDAEPVEAQPTQPPDTTEAIQPVETSEAAQPTTETMQPTSSETVATTEPQILATQAPAETTVVQPPTAEPTVEVQPTETAQAVEPPAEVVTPAEKPVQPAKPVDKSKELVKKPAPKIVKRKSGSEGEGKQDLSKGSSEGTEAARSDNTAQANARRTGSGNADKSNYDGKIRTCVERYIRRVSPSEKNLTVVIRFRINASGQVLSPGIAGGSGNSEVDQAVLAALRKVGSCPSIPSEMGVSSLLYVIPIMVR
ncbi:TonB family protein [Rhizobium sp. NPDC090279]|uniref:cell envelope integrity protein TolA n=1 Tax=Rhizobium sp. NPDC090279 TaxID=3364499 RepID=UPI00383AE3F3